MMPSFRASLAFTATLFAGGWASPAAAQLVDLRDLDLPEWTLEEEFRLGSADGVYDAFGSPSLRIDEAGRLWVLDSRIPTLRVFDAEGEFLREIGSRGEGPGAYLAPATFGVEGDTVWVSDMRTGRVTFFRRDGALIESQHFGDRDPIADSRVAVRMLPGGDFMAISPPGPPSAREIREDGIVRYEQFLLRTDQTGAVRDTLAGYGATASRIVIGGGRQVITLPFVLHDSPHVAYRASLDLVREVHRPFPREGRPAEFRIVLRTRDGRTVRERAFRDEARELTPAVRDSLLTEVERHLGGAPPDLLAAAYDHLEFPEFLTPVTGVVESEGMLWVRREDFQEYGIEYLILDSDLDPIATLRLPRSVGGVASLSGDHLWTRETDEWGVPRLIQYRIRK